MNLLDFFRRKKKRERLSAPPKPVPSRDQQEVEVPSEEHIEEKKQEVVLGSSKSASIILMKPHITEKASNLAGSGIYIFEVVKSATKRAIRKAVEELYNVRVDRVNIIYIRSRTMRLGRTVGRRPGYKKAIIKLQGGEKIEFV